MEIANSDLLWIALALAAAGLAMGFLAGLFGIGGGGIAAPVLYEVFSFLGVDPSIRMHLALGTSLAVMIPTSLRSFQAHRARGSVDMEAWRRLSGGVIAGVIVGAAIVSVASGVALKWVWIAFSFAMAAKLWFGRDSWRLSDVLPPKPVIELWGLFTGMISTMLSIGGGAAITMLMTLYGRSIQTAVGTAAGVGSLIALPGAIGFIWAGWGVPVPLPLTVGYVSLIGAAALIPTSVLAAPWGVRAAHGISRRKLEIAFGCLLAVMGGRFLVSVLGS
ncbi:MAG: sulfite exporter TauE/SafE family protein [Hyphomicrobiaceae bacterium]